MINHGILTKDEQHTHQQSSENKIDVGTRKYDLEILYINLTFKCCSSTSNFDVSPSPPPRVYKQFP